MRLVSTNVCKITFIAVLLAVTITPSFAQVAKSINGMVVSDFKTPQGEVTVKLPDDIRPGDQITGTVTVAPEGKTDKDKQANQKKLESLALQFPGLAMTLKDLLKDNGSNQFNFTVPSRNDVFHDNTGELELLNGDRSTGVSKIPVTTVPIVTPGSDKPVIRLQTPIIEQGDPYAVIRSANADLNNYNYVVRDASGRTFTAHAVCQSPRMVIVEIPADAAIGKGSITAQPKSGGQPVAYNYEEITAEYRVAKDNLQKGETTTLQGTIRGIDISTMKNPTLYLTNVTSSTITLQGGNEQVIRLVPNSNGEFSFERTLTGITPGRFTINALINADPADMADPYDREMRTIRTCPQFNEWMEALKYDLGGFAQSQRNDRNGNANRQNANTVMNALQPCQGGEDLDVAKTRTLNMLRSIIVDPEEIKEWDSYYVSQEYALTPLLDELSGKETEPVDYEMVNEYASCIQHRAEKAGYNKRIGPMISPLLLMLALERAYAEGTGGYQSMQRDLAEQIILASSSLPDDQKPKYRRPNMKEDFIGLLDPAKQTLWATTEQVPVIINKLGAVKNASGLYSFRGVNMYGEAVNCNFKVVVSSVAQINLLFKPLADIIVNGAAAANNQKKDSTDKKKDSTDKKDEEKPFVKGYLIKQDTDSKSGTIYRFYKNAECMKYKDPSLETYEELAKSDKCNPEMERKLKYKPESQSTNAYLDSVGKLVNSGKKFDYDPFETIDVETGRYYKFKISKDWYKCGKGSNTCTETLSIWMVMQIFDDANCKTMIEERPYHPFNSKGKVFSCQLQ